MTAPTVPPAISPVAPHRAMAALLRELDRRCPALARAAVGFALVSVALAVACAIDDARVLGINRWIKPLKFTLSITIYLATIGWFVPYVRLGRVRRAIVVWIPLLMMVGEIIGITTQAYRLETSHYNVSTLANAIIFQSMGIMIALNTIAVAVFTWSFWTQETTLPPAYRAGIRWGLLISFLGMNEAWFMIAANAHTVGMTDGGPGLPFVNWSTTVGDLRIAHFVGIHAMQLLPFVGWRLSQRVSRAKGWPPHHGVPVVGMVAAVYALVAVYLFAWAISGRALVPLG